MYYIVDENVYFYHKEQNKAYSAEVKDGAVKVDFDEPMTKHEGVRCFYSLDEILKFADGLATTPKKKKTEK